MEVPPTDRENVMGSAFHQGSRLLPLPGSLSPFFLLWQGYLPFSYRTSGPAPPICTVFQIQICRSGVPTCTTPEPRPSATPLLSSNWGLPQSLFPSP